jgi:hypothetical protein
VISAHFPAKLFAVLPVAPRAPVTELIDSFDIVLSYLVASLRRQAIAKSAPNTFLIASTSPKSPKGVEVAE